MGDRGGGREFPRKVTGGQRGRTGGDEGLAGMRREWEEVGMCSKEAEALRVEETLRAWGALSWPCMVIPVAWPLPHSALRLPSWRVGGGRGNRLFVESVCLRLWEFSYCIHRPLS